MPGQNFLVNANLVSYWMFEEAATPFVDGIVASGNDLTWGTAPSRSSIRRQGSFSTRGSGGDTVVGTRAIGSLSAGFPATANLTAGWTFGGWMYIASYPSKPTLGQVLLDAIATGGWAVNTLFDTDETIGNVGNKISFGGTGGDIVADSPYSLNQWHLIVIRYNGDNRSGAGANDEQSLWIDNVKQSTTFTPAVWAIATVNPLQWLSQGGGVIFYDEWFCFNIALLDTEIADIFHFGLGGQDNYSPFVVRPELSLFPKPSIAEANLRGEM